MGVHILQKSKLLTVGNRKKNFFSVILFQKFLIFPICTFSEKWPMFRRTIPLNISQISQENTCVGVRSATLLKRDSNKWNLWKLLGTSVLTEHLRWLAPVYTCLFTFTCLYLFRLSYLYLSSLYAGCLCYYMNLIKLIKYGEYRNYDEIF